MSLPLTTSVSQLPGVGDAYVDLLAKLSINTVEDLIHHYPARHEDFSQLASSAGLIPGQKCTIQGQITEFKSITTRNGKKLQFATLSDGQGEIPIVWFNQAYLSRVMTPGTNVSLSGKADMFNNKLSLIAPKFEVVRGQDLSLFSNDTETDNPHSADTVHTAGLIPIYPETAGLTSKWLRAKIKYCLDRVGDVPDWIQELNPEHLSEDLIPITQALHQIHFPNSQADINQARYRLSFDELLFLQFETLKRKADWQSLGTSPQISFSDPHWQTFTQKLPFQLTGAQQRVCHEILQDLTKDNPMNRLVQGDVGSGKTVVAALAAYASHLAGFQTALMAPTEILATQHHKTLSKLLEPLGINVVLHTGRTKHFKKNSSDQTKITETTDHPHIVVGTHALLFDPVQFHNLGLVIIDEQHRFGVRQRGQLISKANFTDSKHDVPHVLSMTATPIPRTIALTLYGNLDISIIDEMPPGRIPPQTHVVPTSKRNKAYEWIKTQMSDVQCQMFIVCPFIEPSETMETVKAATVEFESLKEIFSEFKLSLLHGRQSGDEKETILQEFRDGKAHILVTTPVVEVGVDIPQATIMIIEGAERFGLAQLHQLRGRIGRGGGDSYCFLFTSTQESQGSRRLKALETTHSGFKLAELDLKLRGPGQLYGSQQSGYVDLRIASYSDSKLIAQTRTLAGKLFPDLARYPNLQKQVEKSTIQHIAPN